MLLSVYFDTISLFACGMKGTLPASDRRYRWEEIEAIEQTARLQGVWPVVLGLREKGGTLVA